MEVMDQLKEQCLQCREAIEVVKQKIVQLKNHPELVPGAVESEEPLENIALAYRHLEDAKMRIGKAIQAIDGGTSCYPR